MSEGYTMTGRLAVASRARIQYEKHRSARHVRTETPLLFSSGGRRLFDTGLAGEVDLCDHSDKFRHWALRFHGDCPARTRHAYGGSHQTGCRERFGAWLQPLGREDTVARVLRNQCA